VKSLPDNAQLLDHARLMTLFASLPLGVVVHGLDGRVVSVSFPLTPRRWKHSG
jgi:hypothetical protein